MVTQLNSKRVMYRAVASLTVPGGKTSTFLIFPQILINLTYFASKFSHFLPHFGPPDGRAAHPGRPWLRYWLCMPLMRHK